MSKKDPALSGNDFDFDDSMFSDLDNFDSSLDGVRVDEPKGDSEKNRSPIDKVKNVTQNLTQVGKAAMGAASAGIAMKVKHSLPEVADVADQALTVVSEFQRLKNDVAQQARPTINQTRILGRQLLKYVDDVVPTKVHQKLMNMLGTSEEDQDRRPSKEEARESAVSAELSNIFKVQMAAASVDRKQDAINRIIDQRMTDSRHQELTGMVSDIRNQAIFHTSFLKSTFTAYLKKSLELKYKHLFIAEDTLETLRVTAQMTESGLSAIRHNTALPESQKIHLTEILKKNTKERIIGGFQNTIQNYLGGIIEKVKENYVSPAMDMLGSGNDVMEGLLTMLSMGEDMGEKFSLKKTALGQVGGFIGGSLGAMGGRKVINSLSPEAKKTLQNHAKMGKQGIVLLLEQLRRGELDFDGSDGLADFLDTILPEVDRTGGKFDNDVFKDPNAAGTISKRFTTTVEEIIPGYLSMQTALLKQIASGQPAEELVWDFKKGDFVSATTMHQELKTRIYGTREERGAIMQGNAEVVRDALAYKGKTAQATFEAVSKEVSVFMINLSNSKRWADIKIDELKTVATSGDTSSEYASLAFRGIKNPQEVATAILGFLTNSDGSINHDTKSTMEVRIAQAMSAVSDRHRQAMHDALFNFANRRQLGDMISVDDRGNFQVNDSVRLSAYDDISREEMDTGYGYEGRDSFGRMKDTKKTGLEKLGKAFKDSTIIRDTAKKAVGLADSGLTKLATKAGVDRQYGELKSYLKTKFEILCQFLQDTKQNFKQFTDDIKARIVQKAYDFCSKHEWCAPLVPVLFTEDGTLKESISPPELANLLARIPKLHFVLYKIHHGKNAVAYVLDSMLPHSCIIVAEMTEEEINDLLQKANPEQELTNKVEGKESTEKPSPETEASEQELLDGAGVKKKKPRKRKSDIPVKKQKADGGSLEMTTGEPVGTIDKPTLLAGGKALAGEHGVETVVPHNRTQSAIEAYLQAKAYHEGNTFAEGGTVDPKTGKKRGIKNLPKSLQKDIDELSAWVQSKQVHKKIDGAAKSATASATRFVDNLGIDEDYKAKMREQTEKAEKWAQKMMRAMDQQLSNNGEDFEKY